MKISEQGKELIKQFEGFRAKAYKCPAGVWTIGYGHTRHVKEGDECTKQEADLLLLEDVAGVEDVINRVCPSLKQCQFDALLSFTYNVGSGNLMASHLLARVKKCPSDPLIRNEFLKWKYITTYRREKGKTVAVKSVSNGLLNRRMKETELYFNNNG